MLHSYVTDMAARVTPTIQIPKIMGVATTTDTANSVRTSFGILKNLYGISVQVNETTKKKKEKCTILKKSFKINPKQYFF